MHQDLPGPDCITSPPCVSLAKRELASKPDFPGLREVLWGWRGHVRAGVEVGLPTPASLPPETLGTWTETPWISSCEKGL